MKTVICTIIKDEGRYLEEWIEYHLLMGVDTFHLYDNGSTDGTMKVLTKYIQQGIVVRTPYPGEARQPAMCSEFIERFKRRDIWACFIDVDEFIHIRGKKRSLPSFLEDYKAYGGLAINWVLMGSDGHDKRPEGLVIENYTKGAIKADRHIKTLLNMRYALGRGKDVHSFRSSRPIVNEFNQVLPIDYALTDAPSDSLIALYHYHVKSKEDYRFKCSRNRADIPVKRDFERDFVAHDVGEVEHFSGPYRVRGLVKQLIGNRRNEKGE